MSIFKMFRRKPNTETLQKKAAVDKAYARFMMTLHGMGDYWHEIWQAEHRAQPLKIENKVD